MTGTLYLVPSPLGEGPLEGILPRDVLMRIADLSCFVVEHPKSARHFLKRCKTKTPLQQIEFHVLDEHTSKMEIEALLAPLLAGRDVGLISEAGCPAVADPGSDLVFLAHRKGIRVAPLVGPSSILLSLMASGLGGQRFCFHGYLPVEKEDLDKKIRAIEKASRERDETQIFIETPYRNKRLLDALVENCRGDTQLSIATDLSLDTESIMTKPVRSWKGTELGKRPSVFLIKG